MQTRVESDKMFSACLMVVCSKRCCWESRSGVIIILPAIDNRLNWEVYTVPENGPVKNIIVLETPNNQRCLRKLKAWWTFAETLATCVRQLRLLVSIWTPKFMCKTTVYILTQKYFQHPWHTVAYLPSIFHLP